MALPVPCPQVVYSLSTPNIPHSPALRSTAPCPLPVVQTKAMFERNMEDEFIVPSMAKLGEMRSARVWLENVHLGDAWFLDSITLTHLPSQRSWQFPFANWVPKQGTVLQAKVGPGQGRGTMHMRAMKAMLAVQRRACSGAPPPSLPHPAPST